MDIKRLEGETDFEYKKRLCLLKLNKDIDLDWQEIVDLLELEVSADHLRKISYGFFEYENYLNSNGVATRILGISDLHCPYHLPKEIYKDYVGNIDILVINGDIIDCQSLSKFLKLYRLSPMEEIIQGRQYLIDLISYIKPKRVVINKGNHDVRLGKYLAKNLDSDILELLPETPLDLIFIDGFHHYDKKNRCKTWYEPLTNVFPEIDIEYTGDWKCKIGKTLFAHPYTFSGGILKTAEKAVNYFFRKDRDFDTVILGHTHKVGSFFQGDISLYEQGCCCKTEEMDYMDGNLNFPQQKGFIYLCQNEKGEIIKDKTKLVVLD